MQHCNFAEQRAENLQKPTESAVFLCMTDKHANLCLFPCLFSFPLGFAWYHNFPCGVDTEKSRFVPVQTKACYFLKKKEKKKKKKRLLTTFLAFLCFCLCYCFSSVLILIAVRSLGFPLPFSLPPQFYSLPTSLDVARKAEWGVEGFRWSRKHINKWRKGK